MWINGQERAEIANKGCAVASIGDFVEAIDKQEHLTIAERAVNTGTESASKFTPGRRAATTTTRRKAPGFYPAIHGNARKAAAMNDQASGRLSAYAGQGRREQWRGA